MISRKEHKGRKKEIGCVGAYDICPYARRTEILFTTKVTKDTKNSDRVFLTFALFVSFVVERHPS